MTTYYISPAGSDSNNGLGPDASHATNKPFLTPHKTMDASVVLASGGPHTVYIGPGTYYRDGVYGVQATAASAANPTAWRGDPRNLQGFKDGSGALLAPAPVVLSCRASGETDSAQATASNGIDLALFSVEGARFYDLIVENGNGHGASLGLAQAENHFEDCRIIGSINGLFFSGAVTASRNIRIRRCLILGGQFAAEIGNSTNAATADADADLRFEHCLILGLSVLRLNGAGNKGGGVKWVGCTIVAPRTFGIAHDIAGRHSTTTPSTYEGCLFVAGTAMASSADAGAIVDAGYNRGIVTQNANTSVTEAGTTKRNVPAALILPDLVKWGLALPTDEWFGLTARAASAQRASGWTNTQADFRGRTVRPWGGGPSIGYLEYADISQGTDSQIDAGGANYVTITGAGELDAWVELDGTFDEITLVTESVSYGGSSYPQLIQDANPALGLSVQTATASDATEQTLTLTGYTGKVGPVHLRFVSRSTSGSSTTRFDLLRKGA